MTNPQNQPFTIDGSQAFVAASSYAAVAAILSGEVVGATSTIANKVGALDIGSSVTFTSALKPGRSITVARHF